MHVQFFFQCSKSKLNTRAIKIIAEKSLKKPFGVDAKFDYAEYDQAKKNEDPDSV